MQCINEPFAVGIRFVGSTVAKVLAENLKSIDNIMNASLEKLTNIDEIGERIRLLSNQPSEIRRVFEYPTEAYREAWTGYLYYHLNYHGKTF